MDEKLKGQLLASLEKQFGEKQPARQPRLSIVAAVPEPEPEPPPALDYINRRMHERMIWQLMYMYAGCGFREIYNDAVRGRGCLAKLGDYEVVELHEKMDRARECLAEGISLHEAGLLKESSSWSENPSRPP